MHPLPFLGHPRPVPDAEELIAAHGDGAAAAAAARADRSRGLGNHIRFCHWREVERLIALLGLTQAVGTVH